MMKLSADCVQGHHAAVICRIGADSQTFKAE
jgi:hypothetical protein